MRRGRAVAPLGLVLAGAVLLTAGCSSGRSGSGPDPGHPNGPRVTVQARSIAGVGTVLVTAKGYALYMFQPDNQRSVTCTGACAGTWPPLKVPGGGSFAAGPGVDSALLGTDPDPEGGNVVTYDGWPLYTYTGDVQPGQATGQAIDLNGGEWYVLRPNGKPLIPVP
jgi:predicted lipoprotein with Yx(FWY)xxD motif